MRTLPPDLDRLGSVLTDAIRRSRSVRGDAPPLATSEGPEGLPLRTRPRGDDEPDDGADEGEADPGGEAGLLAIALAAGEVTGAHRGEQPDVEVDKRLGADQREQGGHVPRYAFWTSGLVRSEAELSDI